MIFLFSCHKKNTLNIVELKPSMTIEELSDSTFFKGVSCITHDTVNIFASDVYNGRILKFDLKMNYLGSIGSRGEGPQEFTCLGGVNVLHDTLYAIECIGLKTFTTNGSFVRSVKHPNHYIEPYAFCIDESGYIYVSSSKDIFPLIKYDKYMERQFDFGNRIGGEEERISGTTYKLHFFDNKILSVKEDEPIVSIYDSHGNEILTQNIDNEIFKSQQLFKKQEKEDIKNRKKTYILFQSIGSFENKIYLLYTDRENPDHPHCNRIIELAFENNNFKFTNVYQLVDDWYSSICYAGNKLVCYSDTKEEFQIYEL
jgi:hypothetical protein